MGETDINEILADMLSMTMLSGMSRAAVKKAALKLQNGCIEDNLKVPGGFSMVRSALEKCGTVLAEASEEIPNAVDMVCGVIYSGFGSMNPCYMVISVNNDHINAKAYAKEGLIKQHTAEKAMETFKSALFN